MTASKHDDCFLVERFYCSRQIERATAMFSEATNACDVWVEV
jgi:hypothetical protein